MKIYLLVPVHNRINHTLTLLDSFRKYCHVENEIIIINDGSTDHTKEILLKKYPNINVLNYDGSLFWTGSIQKGINFLSNFHINDNDLLIIANNDVILSSDTIDILLSEIRYRDNHILSALSLDLFNKNKVLKTGTQIKSWFFNISHHIFADKTYNEINHNPVKVDFITFRFVMMKIKTLKIVGEFNYKTFPHYGGDDDFICRARKKNIYILLIPKSKVYLDNSEHLYPKKNLSFFKLLFGIKSSHSIITKFKFAIINVPKYAIITYYLISIVKSFYLVYKKLNA